MYYHRVSINIRQKREKMESEKKKKDGGQLFFFVIYKKFGISREKYNNVSHCHMIVKILSRQI